VSMAYAWDIYPALRLQKKPVELLYMRNAGHVISRPKEQLVSQEMNVDWFDFWLSGHEDAKPEKSEQYARWRQLRKMQDAKSESR
jgi:hypothetical protein